MTVLSMLCRAQLLACPPWTTCSCTPGNPTPSALGCSTMGAQAPSWGVSPSETHSYRSVLPLHSWHIQQKHLLLHTIILWWTRQDHGNDARLDGYVEYCMYLNLRGRQIVHEWVKQVTVSSHQQCLHSVILFSCIVVCSLVASKADRQ